MNRDKRRRQRRVDLRVNVAVLAVVDVERRYRDDE